MVGSKLDPLQWNVPFVDLRTGLPSPEFILQWNKQRAINGTIPIAANPTAVAKGLAINGVAATFMRSDAAPVIAFSEGFGLCSEGLYADGEFLGRAVWAYDLHFPSTYFTDKLTAVVRPESDAAIDLRVNGASVGSLSYASGSYTGASDWGVGGYTHPAGTPLEVWVTSGGVTLYGTAIAIYGDRRNV